ncbi:MAG: PAS domain S-box protein [Rhodobacterales bacterium]|nr:PAS domain S-box protein [Rhodobacterales bacterium]
MPHTAAPAPQARQRRIQLAALAMAAVVCLGVILALALEVQRRLDALGRASSDNVQWTLAQLEVELLKLHGAAQAALNAPPGTAPELNDLRLRFDIFYSRVRTLETSAAFAALRAVPDFGAGLAQARTFLNRTAPLIDGPDPRLAAALPRIAVDVAALAAPARMMSLEGLSVFVDVAAGQRLAVAATLRKVATLTVLLVMALSAALLVLARLYRRGQTQAAENELIRARLEAIINGSVEAIVVVDATGRILEFNPAAVAIFGHPRDRALGAEAAGLLFPPERRAAAQTAIAASLRGDPLPGAGPTVEFEAQRACGARFPVEAAVAPVATRSGGLLVAMLRDISRRRQIERETTEARDRALAGERARAEFQALMSHEMRTPLNGLLGAMEVLHATRLDARQSELLQMMQTSGRLLLHHVNSVLDLSRAESGAVGQERVPFSLEEVVADVIANQQGLAEAAGNRLQVVAVSGPVGRVLGDPVSLRQILLNLVGNAVKFTRQGRVSVEIEAGVHRTPDGTPVTELRVIDTGIGIAESDLARIFDDFVTLDSSYRRQVGGTGLGLGIARRLVEALGGDSCCPA